MFAVSRDGSRLVFGRMLGIQRGQLVLRDRSRHTEVVLDSHTVRLEGGGSFWPQLSPDARHVVYRVNLENESLMYRVSTEGGASRQLAASKVFSLASDWAPDGSHLIGECRPVTRGICRLDLEADQARVLVESARGEQLLYPSYSWDGRWIALMRRRPEETAAMIAPVNDDGSVADSSRWIRVSPEGADAQRPRFTRDGATLFYLLTRGNVTRLVRQSLDPTTKRPSGDPIPLAPVLNIPQGVFNIALQNVVSVTEEHVFYNTAELRANVWMTRLH
jgi:hypothetical protein